MNKDIEVRIENITPHKAKKLLNNNPVNRNIDGNLVAVMVREMKAGEWELTGQSITIANDGSLINGQHRLTAVVESGVTIEIVICRGVDPKVINVIDRTSKPRSAGDVFSMKGYTNGNAISSAINVIHKFSKGGVYGKMWFKEATLSQGQFNKYIEMFPQIQDWANLAVSHKSGLLPASIIGGLGVVFELSEKEIGQAKEFFNSIFTGELLSIGDPVYALRQKLITLSKSKEMRIRPELQVKLVIKTWNSYYKNKPIRKLIFRDNETAPEVLGFKASLLPFYK